MTTTSSRERQAISEIQADEEELIEDNPLLCDVMERNIRTLFRLRREAEHKRGTQERVSDAITDFSGSMAFVYFHAIWFGLWILINSGLLRSIHLRAFDPFPYGLLTMIVSLEAIFLSTFVLVSQNRISEQSERQAELTLQIGLITEHEVTRVLQMLDAIQEKLGIEHDADSELAQLEQETRPEDVLEEIVKVNRRGKERFLKRIALKRKMTKSAEPSS